MAHLNHKGPEEKGALTGKKLGLCNKHPEIEKMGVGLGLQRKGGSGIGQGKAISQCKRKRIA